MSIDGGVANLASWGGNLIMPALSGLFFAGSAYRYSKGGDHERLFFGGFATLMCAGILRTLEAFATFPKPAPSDAFYMALLHLVNFVANVLCPIWGISQFGAMALHMGGVVTEIYPGSVWLRKIGAAFAACTISGWVRLAEYLINNAHGIPVN